MPLSSALLVSCDKAPSFPRQERTTSSVRLRRRRDDIGAARKQERHSGDFSYYRPLEGDHVHYRLPLQEGTRVGGHQGTGPVSLGTRVHSVREEGGPHRTRSKERERRGQVKQCSDEFEFSKVGLQNPPPPRACQKLGKKEVQSYMERLEIREQEGDSGSRQESGVGSHGSCKEETTDSGQKTGGRSQESARRPGLGRRAVTEVDAWKTGYTRVIHRSQETLVKVGRETSRVCKRCPVVSS